MCVQGTDHSSGQSCKFSDASGESALGTWAVTSVGHSFPAVEDSPAARLSADPPSSLLHSACPGLTPSNLCSVQWPEGQAAFRHLPRPRPCTQGWRAGARPPQRQAGPTRALPALMFPSQCPGSAHGVPLRVASPQLCSSSRRFGKYSHDELSILVPLQQCCRCGSAPP